MKIGKLKDFIDRIPFPVQLYVSICLALGMAVAGIRVDQRGSKTIDCDRFYAIEVIVPVVPIACALSKQVYP
jgi:hypothetical protein